LFNKYYPFLLFMADPSYLKLYREGELSKRIEKALALLSPCRLCPRNCGVDRLKGEKGFCKTGRKARIASYNAHFGEEAPLVGDHGSGTIFISSCNLLCSFCQNFDISHQNEGLDAEPEQIALMMLELAERGCHNINFVTPTHVVPQILEALNLAIARGLNIPLVYNSGGYDAQETIGLLDGIFDIYMPDFKFWNNQWTQRFCRVSDYREIAIAAIKEMHSQVGDLFLNEQGLAMRGLLLRHLVMPKGIADTAEIMAFLAKEISSDTYVNVMDQYHPCGNAFKDEYLNHRLTSQEFREARQAALHAGLKRLDAREPKRIIFAL
jgi:putative pyruvate formate lyase activating enzyme